MCLPLQTHLLIFCHQSAKLPKRRPMIIIFPFSLSPGNETWVKHLKWDRWLGLLLQEWILFVGFKRIYRMKNLVAVSSTSLLVFLLVTCSRGLRCLRTNFEGPKTNQSCVYPFIYQGQIYEACTNTSDPDGKLWCSTKTDQDQHHVRNQDQWGYCDPGKASL